MAKEHDLMSALASNNNGHTIVDAYHNINHSRYASNLCGMNFLAATPSVIRTSDPPYTAKSVTQVSQNLEKKKDIRRGSLAKTKKRSVNSGALNFTDTTQIPLPTIGRKSKKSLKSYLKQDIKGIKRKLENKKRKIEEEKLRKKIQEENLKKKQEENERIRKLKEEERIKTLKVEEEIEHQKKEYASIMAKANIDPAPIYSQKNESKSNQNAGPTTSQYPQPGPDVSITQQWNYNSFMYPPMYPPTPLPPIPPPMMGFGNSFPLPGQSQYPLPASFDPNFSMMPGLYYHPPPFYGMNNFPPPPSTPAQNSMLFPPMPSFSIGSHPPNENNSSPKSLQGKPRRKSHKRKLSKILFQNPIPASNSTTSLKSFQIPEENRSFSSFEPKIPKRTTLHMIIEGIQSFSLLKGDIMLLLSSSHHKQFLDIFLQQIFRKAHGDEYPKPSITSITSTWVNTTNAIEREGRRRADAYYQKEWYQECQIVNHKDKTVQSERYWTDAMRTQLRNLPRPANGCRCGSVYHQRVNSPHCLLYRNIRLSASDKNLYLKFMESPQTDEAQLTQNIQGQLHRNKKRIKYELDEEKKEALFVDIMEEIQYKQLGKAIFAPKYMSLMIISAILTLTNKDCQENDSIPLRGLNKKDDSYFFTLMKQCMKLGDYNTTSKGVTLHKLILYMSKTWGHAYQELSHLKFSWLWSNRLHKKYFIRNPRTPCSRSLENVQFLLEQKLNLDSTNPTLTSSYVISTYLSGIIDEIHYLYLQNIITIDPNNGEFLIQGSWEGKNPELLKIMGDDFEECNTLLYQGNFMKYCLHNDIEKVLSEAVNICHHTHYDESAFIKRKEFEEEFESCLDKENGIGSFGIEKS